MMEQYGRPWRPWLISGLTLWLDQLAKFLVTRSFAPGESLPVVPHLVSLTYVQNTGAAFGILKGQQGLFVLISFIIVAWIMWELITKPVLDVPIWWGSALILGGAVGNLIDRLRLGYVIDFIDLHVWPVFNVGDSAITIGVTLLIFRSLIASRNDRTSGRQGRSDA